MHTILRLVRNLSALKIAAIQSLSKRIIPFLILTSLHYHTLAQQPAFTGAEGGGKYTAGGRGRGGI